MKRPAALAGANGAVDNGDTTSAFSTISALRRQALRAAKAARLAGERRSFRLPRGAKCRLFPPEIAMPGGWLVAASMGAAKPERALIFKLEDGRGLSDMTPEDATDALRALHLGLSVGFLCPSIGDALRCQQAIGGRAI